MMTFPLTFPIVLSAPASRVDIQDCIKTIIEGIIGNGRVSWRGRSECVWGEFPQVTLTWFGTATIGVDETRRVYDADGDRLLSTQEGHRSFSVAIKVETDSECNLPSSYYLDEIRLKLRRRCNLNLLKACGVAIQRFGTNQDVPFTLDGREYSASIMDLMLQWAVADTPDDCEGAQDYFDHVEPLTFTPL